MLARSGTARTSPSPAPRAFDRRVRRPHQRLTNRVRTPRPAPGARSRRTAARSRHPADGRLGFWDAATGRHPRSAAVRLRRSPASAVTFSRDGRWLATAGTRHAPTPLGRPPPHPGGQPRARRRDRFEPETRTARCWPRQWWSGDSTADSWSRPSRLEGHPDGARPGRNTGPFHTRRPIVLYADRDGRVWTYDTHTWRSVGRPLWLRARC